MLPSERLTKEATRRISETIQKFPLSASSDRGSARDLMEPKYQHLFLELRDEGIELSKALDTLEEVKSKADRSSIFPKEVTRDSLDARYVIFRSRKLLASQPPFPPAKSVDLGIICVISKSPDDFFVGFIAHKWENNIYRVYRVSQPWSYTLCCSHQICLFPWGKNSVESGIKKGETVFCVNATGARTACSVHRGTFVSDLDEKQCEVLIDGSLQVRKKKFVAKAGVYPTDIEASRRLDELMQSSVFDPSLSEKPAANEQATRQPDTSSGDPATS